MPILLGKKAGPLLLDVMGVARRYAALVTLRRRPQATSSISLSAAFDMLGATISGGGARG
jgi:hypothetical protein